MIFDLLEPEDLELPPDETKALIASLAADFDAAIADGDLDAARDNYSAMKRLTEHKPAVTAAAPSATVATDGLPSTVYLSTNVISAHEPKGDVDRCSICRCRYPGTDGRQGLLPVRTGAGSVKACANCRRRKQLVLA